MPHLKPKVPLTVIMWLSLPRTQETDLKKIHKWLMFWIWGWNIAKGTMESIIWTQASSALTKSTIRKWPRFFASQLNMRHLWLFGQHPMFEEAWEAFVKYFNSAPLDVLGLVNVKLPSMLLPLMTQLANGNFLQLELFHLNFTHKRFWP